jgi:hypothetical protein
VIFSFFHLTLCVRRCTYPATFWMLVCRLDMAGNDRLHNSLSNWKVTISITMSLYTYAHSLVIVINLASVLRDNEHVSLCAISWTTTAWYLSSAVQGGYSQRRTQMEHETNTSRNSTWLASAAMASMVIACSWTYRLGCFAFSPVGRRNLRSSPIGSK